MLIVCKVFFFSLHYAVFRFVWRKKIERDVSHGVLLDEFSVKAERKRQRERMVHNSSPKLLLFCYFSNCCVLFLVVMELLVLNRGLYIIGLLVPIS